MTLFWNSNPSAQFWGVPSALFWDQADAASFTYDQLGRLTGVTFANGTTISYSYDPVGNRTVVAISCGTDGC